MYSIIMFWSGVFLTKAVFYFEQQNKQKRFYLAMSATILQVLSSIYISHLTSLEYIDQELKKLDSTEENIAEAYLQKEKENVSVFMEIYTLLLIKSVPKHGRRYINYKSWPEAQSLIIKMRGIMSREQNKR